MLQTTLADQFNQTALGFHMYAHTGCDDSPTGYRTFTSGLSAFLHPELEIVIDTPNARRILSTAASLVMTGEKFLDNQLYDRVLADNLQVRALSISDNLVRLIMPDVNNDSVIETMESSLRIQHVPTGRLELLH